MIKPEFIDQLRKKTDIVALIDGYTKLTIQNNKTWRGLCPFHRDYKGTFVVSPMKSIFKCFVCGTGGDPIKFLILREQKTFLEAVATLAKKAGMDMP